MKNRYPSPYKDGPKPLSDLTRKKRQGSWKGTKKQSYGNRSNTPWK